MGYYCTVPQCTSLAGKTKNVKFHRFPRDITMADKWNVVLKRGKPYTKYSKVCSLHFTQNDYNVTTMGQWKTLSKDAVPTQNLPKLNPDGSVMVIRKSRTVNKYKDDKKVDSDKADNKSWQSMAGHSSLPLMSNAQDAAMGQEGHDNSLSYRLQNLGSAVAMSSQVPQHLKPKKQDAIMQTDPVQNEDDDTQPNNSYSEVSEKSYSSEMEQYNQNYPKTASPFPKDVSPYTNTYSREPTPYAKEAFPREPTPYKDPYSKDVVSPKESYPKESFHKNLYQKEPFPKESFQKETFPKETFQKDDVYDSKSYEPKDYTKSSDYIPQTNEEYNKAAEQYALERKSHNEYGKEYRHKHLENGFHKLNDLYGGFDKYRSTYFHQNGYPDSVDVLRNQQHNLQILQEQHRVNENQNFFTDNPIKQEIDINVEDDKFMYERTKEQIESSSLYVDRLGHSSRYAEQIQEVKQEPGTPSGCEQSSLAPGSPYYNVSQYYEPRPGAELLIAKQNKLAAQAQLWPNPMKRPFYYSEAHYPTSPILHRYEDIPRILQ